MRRGHSQHDLPIKDSERKYHWPLGSPVAAESTLDLVEAAKGLPRCDEQVQSGYARGLIPLLKRHVLPHFALPQPLTIRKSCVCLNFERGHTGH